MESIKRLTENLKSKTNEEIIKGHVLYFFNDKNKMAILKNLAKISPVLESSEYNEIYALGNPAFYLLDKPVWILCRGIPFSLEMDDLDESNGIYKIKGYSASEIQAKVNSIPVNKVFRMGNLHFKEYLIIFLTNVISILATYIIVNLSIIGGNA